MKKASKTIFCCQACGYQTPKWMGKCPDCGEWHTFIEETQTLKQAPGIMSSLSSPQTKPVPIDSIDLENEKRLLTGIKEFDRVLGGGIVSGSLILIGGDPGIGKSTLMLQALDGLANQSHKVLYISGEESIKQISIRSKRLSTVSPNVLIVSEINLDSIFRFTHGLCSFRGRFSNRASHECLHSIILVPKWYYAAGEATRPFVFII